MQQAATVVLIGDSCVGKSSLCSKFVNDSFSPTCESTLGVDFKVKKLQNFYDKQDLRLNIVSCVECSLICLYHM